MAKNEQKTHIDNNVQEAELVKAPQSSHSNRGMWLAIIVILIVSLASSGWLYWQGQIQTQNYQLQQQEFSTQLGANKDALTHMLTQQTRHQQELQQQFTGLEQNQQRFEAQIRELLAREQLTDTELLRRWALQEVRYMLGVANQRALLAHDIVGAKHALTMADQQLEGVADYKLHPLRALIAEELMALNALADVDVAGIALKLQAAVKAVDGLRVVKSPEVTGTEVMSSEQDEKETVSSDWKEAAHDIWQQVRSLVVIRHNQDGEQAVLVPEQRYFLYQNLKLQLESAKLALLNRDDESYTQALQTAIDWLNRYFTGHERDALISVLKELEGQQLAITIPDISDSLSWLEEYQR